VAKCRFCIFGETSFGKTAFGESAGDRGNNGQGRSLIAFSVFDIDSLRVKSTLTQHHVKRLHFYQINGRNRLDEVEPIRSKSKQEYQTILFGNRKLVGKYKEQRKAQNK
jgi:hypothetical protein